MCSIQDRALGEGRIYRRLTEVLLPNVRIVPSVAAGEGEGFEWARHIGWVLPSTTPTRACTRCSAHRYGTASRRCHRGKLWAELMEEEHQRMPGDAEAMVSQRPIALHARKHLASSDQGMIMVRRMLRRAVDAVRRDEDPAGIIRDRTRDLVTTKAGNAVIVTGDRI